MSARLGHIRLWRCPKCGTQQEAMARSVRHRCVKAGNRVVEFEVVAQPEMAPA